MTKAGPSPRYAAAVAFASAKHVEETGEPQTRKGTTIPYLSHVISVSALVWEAGGDENQAIAAVLHDTLEDTDTSYTELVDRFGQDVADLVAGCSDGIADPGHSGVPLPRDRSTWHARKQTYVTHLATADPRVKLVSAADKLHNATALLWDCIGAELGIIEGDVWGRFNASPEDIVWYYDAILEALKSELATTVLYVRLMATVDLLRERATSP